MATLNKPAAPTPGDSYVQSFARGLQVIRSFSERARRTGRSCRRAWGRRVCSGLPWGAIFS